MVSNRWAPGAAPVHIWPVKHWVLISGDFVDTCCKGFEWKPPALRMYRHMFSWAAFALPSISLDMKSNS